MYRVLKSVSVSVRVCGWDVLWFGCGLTLEACI